MTHLSVDSPVPSFESESVQVESAQLGELDSGSADQTDPVAQLDPADQTSESPFISDEVPKPNTVDFADFWYVVAQTEQLKPDQVLSRMVLGEWLAIFRGADGLPVALRDRCMHRNSRL